MDSQTTAEAKSPTAENKRSVGGLYFYTLLAGIFSLLLLFVIFKSHLRDWKEKFFAKMQDKSKESYNKGMNDRKEKLFEKLRESAPRGSKLRLVEVGSGSGANFKYFPGNTRVICVDPNKFFESYVKEEIKKLSNGVELEEFKVGQAENMSFLETDSVDVVVCSLVLCSVGNVEQSLSEIRRILKPGGEFYFIEHVADEESWVKTTIQTLLAPIWWVLMDCRTRSHAKELIQKAGFSKVQVEYFNANELLESSKTQSGWFKYVMPLFTPHIWGYAVK